MAAGRDGGRTADTPLLPLLRGTHPQVEARLRPLVRMEARRVERIRRLRFTSLPTVGLTDPRGLAALGARLSRRERARAHMSPARLRRARRLTAASVVFDKL